MRRPTIALVATAALIAGCVYDPYYPAYPVVVMAPATFDRSWDAALGAAADAGVQVTVADRATGRITGTKAGAGVTIELQQRPDNAVQVKFTASDSKETNPTLGERWLGAYNRRMGH